jgi:hypothetical protein
VKSQVISGEWLVARLNIRLTTRHNQPTTIRSLQSSPTRREPIERSGILPKSRIRTGLVTRPSPRAGVIDGSAHTFSMIAATENCWRKSGDAAGVSPFCFSPSVIFLACRGILTEGNEGNEEKKLEGTARLHMARGKFPAMLFVSFVSFCSIRGWARRGAVKTGGYHA